MTRKRRLLAHSISRPPIRILCSPTKIENLVSESPAFSMCVRHNIKKPTQSCPQESQYISQKEAGTLLNISKAMEVCPGIQIGNLWLPRTSRISSPSEKYPYKKESHLQMFSIITKI